VEFAKKCGVDLVGFSNADRFDCGNPRNHPLTIYPETKTVIGMGLMEEAKRVMDALVYYLIGKVNMKAIS
jgi:hypothetical protein